MKKTIIGFIGCALMISQFMTSVYATENPLTGVQTDNVEELEGKSKEKDILEIAKSNQKIDIENESYELYNNSKLSFQKLQSQYGKLEEDKGLNSEFQTYLKTIQSDKDNLQLNQMIDKIGAGDYEVNVSSQTFQALENANSGITSEEKKEIIETDEKNKKSEADEKIIGDTDATTSFGEEYNKISQSFKEEYEKKAKENDEKVIKEENSQIKEFGSAKSKSESEKKLEEDFSKAEDKKNKENIMNQFKTNSDKDKKTAEAFGDVGKNNGANITKNYNVLRTAILNAQKVLISKTK